MFKLVLNTPKKFLMKSSHRKTTCENYLNSYPIRNYGMKNFTHPKKLYSSANSRVPPGLKSRLKVLYTPLHVPSCLMEIFFPSKQAVLCSSQWLGNVIPLDPHTVFSLSGHDFLQIQAEYLPTIEHSWPARHRILVHGSKIRM